MANVYSVQLWNNPATPAGGVTSPVVPSGFVWVIRSVTVALPGQPYTRDPGWSLTDHTNTVIVGQDLGQGCGGTIFYQDVHHVIPTGGQLVFKGTPAAYSVLVSGYQLTLP